MPLDTTIHVETGSGNTVVQNSAGSPYQIRSDEVHEIMSKMPHWIIRQGNTVMFAVILLLLAGAQFIRYPDVASIQVHIPPGQGTFALASVPSDVAIKLKPSQQVIIKVSNFPFHEFGVLKGEIASVLTGETATDNHVKISLVSGLTTSSGRLMSARSDLSGTAEIFTANRSVLERLFAMFRLNQVLVL